MVETMISIAELNKIAILLCPVFTSLFAILILLFDIGSSHGKPLELNYYLIAYFCAVFFSWLSAILYFYTPEVYIYINWLSMLAFMLMQVFYYGFIFEVTRTIEYEKFSRYQYFLPVFLSLLLLIVTLIVPVHDQLGTILSKGVYVRGSKLFFYLNYSKIPLRQIFCLVYTILGFRRLIRYHRFIRNFSSNEEKGSLRWVSTLLFFSMYLGLTPLLKLFSSREEMVDSPIAIFFVLSLIYQYAYICLHVIKRDRFIIDLSDDTIILSGSNHVRKWSHTELHSINYGNIFADEIEQKTKLVIGEVKSVGNGEGEDEMSPYLKKNVLNRDSFNAFMKDQKPYLNADLRITDMVEMLHVNRTYISSFINREYGVNFSIFINKYRLLEYNALREMPEYCKMSKSELAEIAGFNSYRSFQRTEKEVLGSNKRGLKDLRILINI